MRLKIIIIAGVVLAAAVAGIRLLSHSPDRPVVTIAPSGKLLLSGVTVVDTHDGKLSPAMDVLTDKGQIISITPSRADNTPTDTQVVDARGKFVIPGYNDLHAHPLNTDDPSGTLALMLANGITGFRQMSGSPELLKERRESRLPTGRYSPALLVTPGDILLPINAVTPEDAIQVVHENKAEGADFIKVVLTSPAVFFAALTEAKRVGLPFVGHLQQGVDAAEASKAGMKAIEHLGPGDTVLVSCSTDEAALRAAIAKRPPVKGPPIKPPAFLVKLIAGAFAKFVINPVADEDAVDINRMEQISNTFSEEKCQALAAVFVANDTWHVPTLIREKSMELPEQPEFANDANLRYMPPSVVKSWRDVTAEYSKHQTADTKRVFGIAYALQLRLAKLFDASGVKMMAGSDEGGGGLVPGFCLHQEFDELAMAGISPLHILQMTTLNGAEFLGRTATMGTVEPGKNADLVLLDANPIDSVQNFHKIAGVVRAGYYYSRQDIDNILARVEAGKGYFH